MMATLKRIRTGTLDIAFEESGPADGAPVLLMHGWPYDPRVYDAVAPQLVAAGCRTIVPYLRGFGATQFLSSETPRSGQQAALGNDLKDLMDALALKSAALVGYDWGGRAACIVAALWPERARCLVTGNGYNIQDIPHANVPAAPEQELRYWYQYYFHTERGRAGLTQNRRALIRLLWRLWSPNWDFDDATFEDSASSWDNPDFVDVTIQSYRHRYGNAPGDPALEDLERRLTTQPSISVPTIVLQGDANGVVPELWSQYRNRFTGRAEQRVFAGVGHNIPAEVPDAVAEAVLDLLRTTSSSSP
jgi:pimeloyl-ACP methyl ester carboxylesterase